MATGFSRTIEAGHEPFYEFACTQCSKEGRNVEAMKYCVECCEFMCNGCLKHHDRFAPLSAHRMLEGDAMTAQGQHNQPSFPTKRCDVHNGEIVTIYCHTHDSVCCSTCVALDHRPCKDLIYLTEDAQGVKESREYKAIKVSMKKILTDLGKIRNARQNDKTRLGKDTQNVEANIKDFRKSVNKFVDDLQKATINQLRAKHKERQDRINADIKTLEDVITTVEDNTKQLENTNEENESEIFVTMKKIKAAMNDGNDVIRDISRGDRIETIQFNLNRKLEEYLKSLSYFGDFSESSQPVPHSPIQHTVTSSKKQPDQNSHSSAKQTTGTSYKKQPDQTSLFSAKQTTGTSSKQHPDHGSRSPSEQTTGTSSKQQPDRHTISLAKQTTGTSSIQQPAQNTISPAKQTTGTSSKQQPDQNRLYSARQHSQVNVDVNTDSDTCNIYGSCQLQDGTVLIVDYNNSKIKRLDASYAVSDYYDVLGGPYAVCCTGPREVAVSVLLGKTIKFVSVGTKCL